MLILHLLLAAFCVIHPPIFYLFFATRIFIFVMGLLRYNLYATQIVHLKHTMQWFLGYSQSCTTITTINFTTLLSSQKETLYSTVAISF